MNSKHKNISFSYEIEKDGVMPFLDVNIFREKGKFVNNVYRKETFTGVYTNLSSFMPLAYKFGLAYTLLHRCFNLVSDMSKFHLEVAKLKKILLKNGYPRKIINACVFKFLNKFFEPKSVTLTVPKKQLFFVLPFMGNMLGVIKTGLSKALQKRLPFCKLGVIFKSTNCLKSYFNFKDVLLEPLRSCQI